MYVQMVHGGQSTSSSFIRDKLRINIRNKIITAEGTNQKFQWQYPDLESDDNLYVIG